ncbi:MarR family transcriptional regulator [Acidaminobacter sp. JC074]|uniref:MarR family winged helix-turn-helix transcriptional regulator n=1 Tax=Acidaminobacter sp. JC074 TaxID=2530199 RepID=UPI001F0E1CFE|nr:MarR family transcriptional regulator [Acidaminobacter sp. JC074]MCH4887502.1 MarR family transcriptional regulator [Acidaminobacter sp. JC074]
MTKKIFNEEDYLCCVDEVGETVKRIVRNFQMMERDQIKPLGFTTTQCYCMIELLKSPLTMHELSTKMNLNSSTMTRIVDKLVRDDLIIRTRDASDRRIVVVSLSESGHDSAEKVRAKINDYYKDITKHLPKNRVDEVLEAVSLLMDAFEKANPNCC